MIFMFWSKFEYPSCFIVVVIVIVAVITVTVIVHTCVIISSVSNKHGDMDRTQSLPVGASTPQRHLIG